MSLQVIKTRAPRYKAFKPPPIVHHIEYPRGNGLRIYHGEEWFAANDIVHQTMALLSPRKIPHQSSSRLSKSKPRVADPGMVEVFDSTKKSQELGRGLQIHCLAGGIGIAMTGRYRQGLKPGQIRHDAFLAHLVEGRMRETLKQLLVDVAEAKKKGFITLSLLVCYRDEKTLSQDPRMVWNSKTISEEIRLRESLVQMLEEALDESPDLVPYNVLDEKSICIGSERLIKINNV
ncbi:hypothetical protein N0V93_009596 [Gnomoniopsis smithogilvyi]|uniref:Uncharacterized protein n=1 Tax=Gnomoniopsis smithogilvyi TaxID=1191159 RepID=A0A9W9CTT7_9PEZI|nr:hypothetical protein N0V93_009596 [Gnomoniopsis smithogilvyi]